MPATTFILLLSCARADPAVEARTWLAQSHDYRPAQANCQGVDQQITTLLSDGGAMVPAGQGRWAAVWFPEGWKPADGVVFTLSGYDACTLAAWNTWHELAPHHGAALVGIHYMNGRNFPDTEDHILTLIRNVAMDIEVQTGQTEAPLFLYGFSLGASKVIAVAYEDRKEKEPLLDGFIVDSGGATIGGPDFTKSAADNPAAFAGARFWMYCGMADDHSVETGESRDMCARMAENRDFINARGGTVDVLFQDPGGRHGMYGAVRNQAVPQPTEAMESLYSWMHKTGGG